MFARISGISRFVIVSSIFFGLGNIALARHADPERGERPAAKDATADVELLNQAQELYKLLGTKAAEDSENLKKLRAFMVKIGGEDKDYSSSQYFEPYEKLTHDLSRRKEKLSAKLLEGILPHPKAWDRSHGSVAQEYLIRLVSRIYKEADRTEGQFLADNLANALNLLDGEILFCKTLIKTQRGWDRALSQDEVDFQKTRLEKFEKTKLEILEATVEKWKRR